jgi:hypothetical protein
MYKVLDATAPLFGELDHCRGTAVQVLGYCGVCRRCKERAAEEEQQKKEKEAAKCQ